MVICFFDARLLKASWLGEVCSDHCRLLAHLVDDSISLHDVCLGGSPLAHVRARVGLDSVELHLTNQLFSNLIDLFSLVDFLLTLGVLSLFLQGVSLANRLVSQIILESVFHEQSTCNWIDCLLVHLFDVLDE